MYVMTRGLTQKNKYIHFAGINLSFYDQKKTCIITGSVYRYEDSSFWKLQVIQETLRLTEFAFYKVTHC